MKLSKSVTAAALLGLAAAALAGEEVRTKMAIAVVEDNGDGEIRIELDSDELGFDLHDMQEGENRSIVDKNGRTILVTREADGFRFDVDGKTVRMPAFEGGPHGHRRHDRRVWMEKAGPMEGPPGITILSGKPIDESTQHAIRSLLESAGHDSEVRFVDHESGHPGPHRIKVIEKTVEASE